MNVIVITPDHFYNNEVLTIQTLFEQGMEILHIRKPNANLSEIKLFISQINAKWYSKILISYICGVENLNVKGFHFNKKNRILLENKKLLYQIKQRNQIITTSVHTPQELKTLPISFDAIFVSPIFKSISKPNYLPSIDWNISHTNYPKEKLIALGGINARNIIEVIEKGFCNIALLGTIWQDENQTINNFKSIMKKCQKQDLL